MARVPVGATQFERGSPTFPTLTTGGRLFGSAERSAHPVDNSKQPTITAIQMRMDVDSRSINSSGVRGRYQRAFIAIVKCDELPD
ncbi:MAG: hypothetical protein R2706_19095 [Acidimicrobiales bacterium]